MFKRRPDGTLDRRRIGTLSRHDQQQWGPEDTIRAECAGVALGFRIAHGLSRERT